MRARLSGTLAAGGGWNFIPTRVGTRARVNLYAISALRAAALGHGFEARPDLARVLADVI